MKRRSVLWLVVGAGLLLGCGSDSGGGASDQATDAGESGGGGEDGGEEIGETSLTGTLGALGDVQSTVASFVISNSGETLVYLSSKPLTCELLMVEGGRWLPKLEGGGQVVEIVVKGAPKLGRVGVGPAEVNYAPTGMSSSHETGARSGSVTFTKSEPMGVVEGHVDATYASGNLTGVFHAEFCPGGQQY